MKKAIILLFIVLPFTSFSQESNWEEYKNVKGVVIKSSHITCHNNEVLTFQISNTNDYKVIISWYEEVWVEGICKQEGKKSPEHFREVFLLPEEIVEGDCTFQESFYIGSKVYRGDKLMKLTHFQLNSIKVLSFPVK